ncbi:MAG: thioredoxin domain-containing protein [Candidatus Daviesbacteria bacterium]|nr:thioredoxin domain-containing protein [Candidatus Daviesbacteria bacterium]
MKYETKILGAILIITVVILFGGIFLLSRNQENNIFQIDYSRGQKIGSDSAKVRMVEFSDFECLACSAVEPYIVKLRAADPSKIQLIYRHFPLSQHAHSSQAAALAEAAGEQGKFWEMHDKLLETQAKWSSMNDATAFFMDLVKELGLDEDKIKQTMAGNVIKAKIDSDVAEGNSLGISQTPTFFVNGRKLDLQKFEDLDTLVEQELKK